MGLSFHYSIIQLFRYLNEKYYRKNTAQEYASYCNVHRLL